MGADYRFTSKIWLSYKGLWYRFACKNWSYTMRHNSTAENISRNCSSYPPGNHNCWDSCVLEEAAMTVRHGTDAHTCEHTRIVSYVMTALQKVHNHAYTLQQLPRTPQISRHLHHDPKTSLLFTSLTQPVINRPVALHCASVKMTHICR